MKQFKFRAWHKELKHMQDFMFSDIFSNELSGQYLINSEKEIMIPLKNCEIMQYLGATYKDCNDVELCEGDIIKYGNEDIFSIIFYSSCFLANSISNKPRSIKWKICEKIGNIYQNPELLTENNNNEIEKGNEIQLPSKLKETQENYRNEVPAGLLILTRNISQSVFIGNDIIVYILGVNGYQVSLGFSAPKDIPIHRSEIHARIKNEKKDA